MEIGSNSDSEEKKDSKIVKPQSSLQSGGEGGTGDGSSLRRHKSLDGGDQCNLQKSVLEDKEKNKKDPRIEHRIRNKDRPAMEIYRPGMGIFRKQRLQREKSNNDERASLSQSPTPNPSASGASKSGKPGTEHHMATCPSSGHVRADQYATSESIEDPTFDEPVTSIPFKQPLDCSVRENTTGENWDQHSLSEFYRKRARLNSR